MAIKGRVTHINGSAVESITVHNPASGEKWRGRLVVRPGGMVVFVPLDERPQTVIGDEEGKATAPHGTGAPGDPQEATTVTERGPQQTDAGAHGEGDKKEA